nr:MAG TPA: Minor structural protein 4 [Caudoviricetes sp.]
MTAIDNIINQIEGETQNRGNTKTRVAAVLRLLRDKIANLFSDKLDKGTYTGNAGDLIGAIGNKVDKVPGKILSTNDFTNELRTKLEGLRNVDISGLLPKGGYTGTAQNLKELIDNIMRILQSPDTELDELREIVAYIKQNKRILETLGISNIAGLQDALNGKAPTGHNHDDRYSRLGHTHSEYALRTHRHNWDNIDGKPSMDFAPRSHRHNWSDIDGKPALATEEKIQETIGNIQVGGRNLMKFTKEMSGTWMNKEFWTLQSENYNELSIYRSNSNWNGITQRIQLQEGETYTLSLYVRKQGDLTFHLFAGDARKAGTAQTEIIRTNSQIVNNGAQNIWYRVYVSFKVTQSGFCFARPEKLGTGYIDVCGFKLERGNIPTDWSPAPEDFLVSNNARANSSITLTHAHNNATIFLEGITGVDMTGLEDLDCVSFRKVYAGGAVTFSCAGKTIIYTGDNAFNGGDGSTAVVSIWNSKCYIDIRNV